MSRTRIKVRRWEGMNKIGPDKTWERSLSQTVSVTVQNANKKPKDSLLNFTHELKSFVR